MSLGDELCTKVTRMLFWNSVGEAALWAITIDPSATYSELANKAHFLDLRQNSAEKSQTAENRPSELQIDAANVYPIFSESLLT